MCQSCNAFCINQRKEAKNARVQLVIGLQGQTPKLFDLRAGIGIADRLIDPRGANLDMGK